LPAFVTERWLHLHKLFCVHAVLDILIYVFYSTIKRGTIFEVIRMRDEISLIVG